MIKDTTITIRIASEVKEKWQEYCRKQGITLTSLLICGAYHYIDEVRPLRNESNKQVC